MNFTKILQYRGGLDGLKTILGAALIVLSHQVGLFEQLIVQFPELPALNLILGGIKQGVNILEQVLYVIGNLLLVFGVGHKAVKLAS